MSQVTVTSDPHRASPFRRSTARPCMAAVSLLALSACTAPRVGTDVLVTGMPNPEVALRDSMRLVDAEMTSLGTLGRSAGLPVRIAEPIVPGELQKTVTFTYSGPLDDGVRRLADEVGYRLTITPAPPPAPGQVAPGPLTVNVSTGFVTAYAALKALGDAAGSRALVRVDPRRHLVEVIYNA